MVKGLTQFSGMNMDVYFNFIHFHAHKYVQQINDIL